MTDSAAAPRHLPGLDGLRGLAVLGVLLFHWRSLTPVIGPFVNVGWLGVDLFFALSGFLVGSLVFREPAELGPVARFLARRALRTWPAYAVLLAAVAIWRTVPAPYFFYAQNYALFPADVHELHHTWSLCIEEHFYLGLAVVWLLCRRPQVAALVLGGAVLVAVIGRVGYLQTDRFWFAYGRTHTHIDGLCLGALAALAKERWGALVLPYARWAAGVGVVCALAATGHMGQLSAQLGPWGFSLFFLGIALGSVGVVLLAADGDFRRLLTARPLMLLGRVSYGVYLYHYPIFALGWHPAAEAGALVAAVSLSWFLVERPMLRLKDRMRSAPPPQDVAI